MTDVDFLSPQAEECIWATHIEILARAAALTGVVNGNAVTPTSPASMDLDVGAGRIRIVGVPLDVDGDTVTVGESDVVRSRIDIIIRDAARAVQVVPGVLDVIEDAKGLGDWHQYILPAPPATIPEGAILAAIFVGAGVTALGEADIWMMAGQVGDIITTATNPGVDTAPLSEKAAVAAFAPIAHASSTSNPHAVTASQVGLGNVTNDAQVKASEKAAASGVASLDANSKVEQNPASASATPGNAVIPIAGADGKIAAGFLPTNTSINPLIFQVFS